MFSRGLPGQGKVKKTEGHQRPEPIRPFPVACTFLCPTRWLACRTVRE